MNDKCSGNVFVALFEYFEEKLNIDLRDKFYGSIHEEPVKDEVTDTEGTEEEEPENEEPEAEGEELPEEIRTADGVWQP